MVTFAAALSGSHVGADEPGLSLHATDLFPLAADPRRGYAVRRHDLAEAGGFTTRDPIPNSLCRGGDLLNQYTYVLNRPTVAVDPSGQSIILELLAAAGRIAPPVGAAVGVGFIAVDIYVGGEALKITLEQIEREKVIEELAEKAGKLLRKRPPPRPPFDPPPPPRGCRPCEPPEGSMSYWIEGMGLVEALGVEQATVVTWHYIMRQTPYPECICLWEYMFETPGYTPWPWEVPYGTPLGGGPM